VNVTAPGRALTVLHVDESLLIVSKPAGMPSVHDATQPDQDAPTALAGQYGELWVVHRLDKETSGVLVLARTAEAHAQMSAQFEAGQVEKVYHAVVRGEPRWDDRVVDAPLLPDGDRKHRTVIDQEDGKPSVTRLKVLRRFRGLALIEARPETGRTHQIRVHLAAIGHPVVGDATYGGARSAIVVDRPMLHARRLEFEHPTTGEPMSFECDPPADMAAVVALCS